MTSLLDNIRRNVMAPLYHFRKTYISKAAVSKVCSKFSSFIYKKSDDIPFMLLFFNAISVISSHVAQINGLKKSDRENKDYLINQEVKELGLDIAFTILPPFMLKNFLSKKFYSGQWTTKSARKNLLDTIAPTVGASKDDLYNTMGIKPIRATIGEMTARAIDAARKFQKLPKCFNSLFNLIEKNKYVKIPNHNDFIPIASMKEIALDFDKIRKGKFNGFRNGKAYDEIIGQFEGMTVMATLAYTVIASSIITPILKNKLANRSYKKQLEKQEQELGNKDVNERFKYAENPLKFESEEFDIFSNIDNISNIANNNVLKAIKNTDSLDNAKMKSPFESFERFNNAVNSRMGMRI